MQTAVKCSSLYIHHPGALRASGVVYITSDVFYSNLHIHHQIVHTSHFLIFPRPKPGGGVYLCGPNTWCIALSLVSCLSPLVSCLLCVLLFVFHTMYFPTTLRHMSDTCRSDKGAHAICIDGTGLDRIHWPILLFRLMFRCSARPPAAARLGLMGSMGSIGR